MLAFSPEHTALLWAHYTTWGLHASNTEDSWGVRGAGGQTDKCMDGWMTSSEGSLSYQGRIVPALPCLVKDSSDPWPALAEGEVCEDTASEPTEL